MGLPRSNLVKSKPLEFAPVQAAAAVPIPPPLPQLASAFDPEKSPQPLVAPSGSVDVVIDAPEVRPPNASIVDAGPSAKSLLERAAAMGPVRATWESFVLPNDPILAAKFQPRVAERRARLRRVVKITLGACAALCFASLVASALGGGSEAQASSPASVEKATPATSVTTVEKMDEVKRGKAAREVPAHPMRRASVGAKHR